MVRALVVAVIVLLSAQPAHARRGGGVIIIVSGDEIEHVRDLPAELAAEVGAASIGYHYQRFGLFWLDLWRWDGEFVIYDGAGFSPISAEQLELLGGGSVPWRYHLPPGLLIVIGLIELAIVTKTRRRVRVIIAIGAALLVTALVFYLEGLEIEFLVPGLLGLHHIIGSLILMNRPQPVDEEPAHDEPEESTHEPMEPEGRPVAYRPSPPNVETDPFRAPPQPPPIVIARKPTHSDTPLAHDENAEPPKLLR